jgi:hypothetical protein
MKKRTSGEAGSGTTKEYSEGRFQLRLPNPEGSVVVISLQAHQSLVDLAHALADHPQFNHFLDRPASSLRFSTTYPRKLFSHDEMVKSIKVSSFTLLSVLLITYSLGAFFSLDVGFGLASFCRSCCLLHLKILSFFDMLIMN